MASASLGPGTFAEFLAWEQVQERRHEYIDHVAVMMAGGTRAHDRIQRNLLIRATERLRGSGCEPLGPDMIIETGTGNGRYPDMTIDCGRFDPDALTASAPTAVFEVLSDSTRKTDLLIKLRDYDATPSIRHYVLIAQTEYLVFVYSRADSGNFSLRPKELRQPGKSVELPDLGLSLTLAEIYEGIGLTAGASGRQQVRLFSADTAAGPILGMFLRPRRDARDIQYKPSDAGSFRSNPRAPRSAQGPAPPPRHRGVRRSRRRRRSPGHTAPSGPGRRSPGPPRQRACASAARTSWPIRMPDR